MVKTEKLIEPTKIVKHETYPDMYRLEYEDGYISKNFYNLTRAADILKNYKDYCKSQSQRKIRMPISEATEPLG
jgi:hypothetical protein